MGPSDFHFRTIYEAKHWLLTSDVSSDEIAWWLMRIFELDGLKQLVVAAHEMTLESDERKGPTRREPVKVDYSGITDS